MNSEEAYYCSQQQGTMVAKQEQEWIQAVQEELSAKAVVQVMWLKAKEALYSALETMAVVHNLVVEEEELKLLDAVGTMAGDEEELANQQEALVLQNCNCNHPQTDKIKMSAKVNNTAPSISPQTRKKQWDNQKSVQCC